MPRSKKPVGKGSGTFSGSDSGYGVKFCNISLSDGDKEAVQSIEVTDGDLFLAMEELATDGYKLSMHYDTDNSCGACSLTGQKGCVEEANIGKCVTARGPDVRSAIVCLLYKLRTYCLDGVFPDTPDGPKGGYR